MYILSEMCNNFKKILAMNLRALFIYFVFIFSGSYIFAQTIVSINPTHAGGPSPKQWEPTLFCQPRNTAGDAIWNGIATKYNCLRTTDIEWFIRSSTSMSQALTRIKNSKSWHLDKAQKTDKLIIVLCGMPKWLSSSADTTIMGDASWRKYNTVKPSSYTIYDSLIRCVVDTVQSWGINPYFEIWNEPDNTSYWTGTTEELLELYHHTATAVKQANPAAKVGAFGVNGWASRAGQQMLWHFGYYPDSIGDKSLLSALIDSSVSWSTPLDFISWHLYGSRSNEYVRAANYFKTKLASSGIPSTGMFITEWNSWDERETSMHAPQVLQGFKKMAEANITGHNLSCFQDFAYDPVNEFFGEYGMISHGGLIKPAFKAVMMLNYLQYKADTIRVNVNEPMISFASLKTDTLNILLSNYVFKPNGTAYYAAYNELLYNHPINQVDLAMAGYYTSGKLDSTFRGLIPPTGPAAMISAFNDAKKIYAFTDTSFNKNRNIELHLRGQKGLRNGRMVVIDSDQNNVIHLYDSLRNNGFSRAAAISQLLANQSIVSHTVQITDSIYNFSMEPNATVFLEFYGIDLSTGTSENNIYNSSTLYPNPFSNTATLILNNYNSLSNNMRFELFNVIGNKVMDMPCNLSNGNTLTINRENLSNGMYLYSLKDAEGKIITNGKVIIE